VSTVQQAQSEAAQAERRAAVRRLLVRPLLGQREDPDAYAGVVRHRRALTDWFAEHTGWQLVVDASGGFARLHKTDPTDDDTRPAVAGRQARPFDRRRYVLLCLTLAALDHRPGQTSLKHVAEAVETHSREQPGIEPFDAARMADRRALVDVLRLLGGLGVLTERDGDSDRYAASGTGDALYDVDDRRLGQLISAPSSPSLVDGPDDLPVEVYPDTDDGQRLRSRHRVMRRVLDEPVVYYDDLDERERDWLVHSLAYVHDVCDRDVGLLIERRAEGLAAVDTQREVTDETFPDGSSTVKHAALLIAEHLCARVRAARAAAGPDSPPLVVGDAEAVTLAGELLATYGQRCGWSATYRERDDGAAALAADAFALLRRFRLVDRCDGGFQARPAIARFAPGAPAAGRPQPMAFTGELRPVRTR
jgi:uncharacterized protein (TIGR02678 family)